MQTEALFHTAPGRVEWRPVELPAPGAGELLIETRRSAISPGTETLLFQGEFPPDQPLDASLPALAGRFRHPFRYGYALLGRVLECGPGVCAALHDRWVFAFHPHQRHALVDAACCWFPPPELPPEAALFLPNLESALGIVLDAAPRIGERALVLGQGVVGLLVMALLARFPLAERIAAEPLPQRRALAGGLGADQTFDPTDPSALVELVERLRPDAPQGGIDFAIEVSGRPEALDTAIALAGFDARILVASWYGIRRASVDLGGAFHRRRLRLVSTQVSHLDPALVGRWSPARRLELAGRWLAELRPERLISHRLPLERAQEAFQLAASKTDNTLQVILDYAPEAPPCTASPSSGNSSPVTA